jgi:hypothetical protein
VGFCVCLCGGGGGCAGFFLKKIYFFFFCVARITYWSSWYLKHFVSALDTFLYLYVYIMRHVCPSLCRF